MAYVYDPNQDEDQAAQNGQAATVGPEKMVSGEGGVITGGAGGAVVGGQGGAQDPAKPSTSGNWINLNKYLDANQGADQRMGQGVKQVVDNQAKDYQDRASAYEQQGRQAIQQNTVQDQGVLGGLKALGSGQNQALDKAAFERQYNAAYQGPRVATDIGGYSDAQTANQKTEALGKLAGQGDAGRRALLGNTFGGSGKYSAGEQNLDSFILGGNTEGAKTIGSLADQYGNYGQNWQALTSQLQDQIGQAQKTTDDTRTATQGAAAEAKAALDARLAAAKAQADQKNSAESDLYKRLSGGDVGALTSTAGLDQGTINYLKSKGYNFGQLAQAGGGYTLGDLASDGDVGGYQQLMGLLGQNSDYDLAKGGGKGTQVVGAQTAAAKQAAALQSSLEAKLRAQNDARENALAQIQNGFTSFDGPAQALAQLGISQDDYNMAKEAGIDPMAFVKGNRKLELGDVLSDQDRSGYSSLLQQLGLGTDGLADPGDEGGAYNFGRGDFNSQLGAYKAKKASEAAKATQEAQAKQGASQISVPTPYGNVDVNPSDTKMGGDKTIGPSPTLPKQAGKDLAKAGEFFDQTSGLKKTTSLTVKKKKYF